MTRSLVDWRTAACLHNGYHVALAVDGEGRTWPWLLAADDNAEGGCRDSCCAPHEQTGRVLPAEMRHKLGLIHYCGALTAKGTPCRMRVPRPGARCDVHRERVP